MTSKATNAKISSDTQQYTSLSDLNWHEQHEREQRAFGHWLELSLGFALGMVILLAIII